MSMLLSNFQRQAGRPDDAVKTLRQSAKLLPDDAPTLEWTLADLLIQLGRTDEAAALIDGDQPAEPKTANAKSAKEAGGLRSTIRPELIGYLEAQIAIHKGQWSEAAKLLKSSVVPALAARSETRELTKRARLLLASCYERLGDAGQRYESARLAAAINLPEPDPLWVAAHLELAASLVGLGRTDDALAQYQRVLPRDPKAGVAIARLQIAQALRQPEAERNWKPVNQTLDDLDRANGGDDLTILRAEALIAQNKRDDAAVLIDQALVKHPDQAVLWVARAGLAGQGGKTKEALAVLDEGQQRLGHRIEFAIARAVQIARGGGDDAPAALAELEHQGKELSDADRDRLWRELGAAYTRLGRDRDARRVWTELAERRQDDLTVRLLLFDLAMREKDDVAAERAIEEVQRVEGQGGPLHDYGKARLLMARAEKSPDARRLLAEAGELLARAGARRASWAQIPLAEAELAMRNHQPEQAITKYTRAVVELRDRTPSAVLGLLQLLGERGRYGEAMALIQELRKEGPISSGLQRLGAELAYRDRNYDLGLSLLSEADAARSTDYRDPLLAGLLCSAAKRPAEPLLRKAVTLAPLEPKTHEALILYLAAQGQKDQATLAIQEAKKALPADQAQTSLVLAKGFLAIGDQAEAGRIYEAALKAHREDAAVLQDVALYRLAQGDRTAAESLLREVLDLKKADPGVVSTAKRVLSDLAARGGRPEDARQALRILGLDGKTAIGAGSPPEDLRAKARILAGQPGRARHRDAIGLLETLRKRQAETADDLFLLAQLHEANGDWPKARDLMLKLLNDHPKNVVYMARYIQGLLRHDQADEAQFQLKKLQQLVPDPSATIVLEGRVLKAKGHGKQAATKLLEFAHGGAGRLEFAARQLEEIGEQDTAESLYREAAKARPEAVLALAGYLGRRGKVKEAIDLIDDDQVWKTLPPEVVANTGVAIFYGARSGDDRQHHRLLRRIEAAIRQHPEKDSLQFDLANLQILQGRYAEAEAVFRTIHERDKTKSGPLNNLAWLLAIQGDGRGPEALALIQKAIELDGERSDLLDTRGVAHLAMGQADLAIQDLEDAIVGAPPSAEMQYHLARAYLLAGKRSEAAKALRVAESLGLTADTLHPLERKAFDQVRGDLARQ
jgi:predicted Zn-dependent protease